MKVLLRGNGVIEFSSATEKVWNF